MPEVGYGVALEHNDEEEGSACDDGGTHGSINNPGMYPFEADTKVEKSNGEFGEYHGPSVEDVTEPPAMFRSLNSFLGQVMMMATCPVVDADIRRYRVEEEEQLGPG